MNKKDFYNILNISRNANNNDIKIAYRKLAMKYHPDRNPNNKIAEEKFKEIKEAYEILSNPQKRRDYDKYGHSGVDPNKGFSGNTNNTSSSFSDIFGDIFSDIFGGTGRTSNKKPKSNRGTDICYKLDITLEQSARGSDINITVPIWFKCESCKGSGSRFGTSIRVCPNCKGSGEIRMRRGFFNIQQTCQNCNGEGKIIIEKCSICSGISIVKKNKHLTIKIPIGINDGMRICYRGIGNSGRKGGANGDLYIEVKILKHNIFKRIGNDLHCDVPISFVRATLGGEIEIPTFNEKIKFRIPEGTQTGRIFRLRGKGIKGMNINYYGDLLCHIIIETPVRLTNDQKRILINFGNSINKDNIKHSPAIKTWLDKIKELFE